MLGMALDNISPDLRFYRDRKVKSFGLLAYAPAAHMARETFHGTSLHGARLCCAYAARTLAYAPAANTARETFHETSLLVRGSLRYAAQTLAYAPAANTARKYIQIAGIQSFLNLTCYTEIMKLLQCVGMIYAVR